MKKQILSAVLISTMLAATLAGCGSKAADPTTAAPAAQTEAAKGEETKAPETEAKAEEPKVDDANLSEVEKIIKEAESMSMEELAKKAIEESNISLYLPFVSTSKSIPVRFAILRMTCSSVK